jgi:general secretion pathway protein B
MSFILDALKKLEQKRHEGSVPDLMTVHPPEIKGTRKRPLWLYLFLAALLVNAVILTAMLRPRGPEKQDIIAQADVEQHHELIAAGSDRKDADSIQPVPAPSPAGDKLTADDKTSSPGLKSDMKASLPETESTAQELPGTHDSTSRQESPVQVDISKETTLLPEKIMPADNTSASLELNPSPKELENLRNKIKEELSPASEYSPVESQPPDDIKIGSDLKVIEYGQLPESVRKELPDIYIKGHIYSNDPLSRIVNINGIIIREGDTVTDGLKVEKITLSGIILDYQGVRFHMRAF